jgi:hypothetical protein
MYGNYYDISGRLLLKTETGGRMAIRLPNCPKGVCCVIVGGKTGRERALVLHNY